VTLSELTNLASIVSSFATAGVAAAALYWFLFTRSFKRRIEFDVDLHIFDLGPDQDYVAELILTLNNRGQREHRLYNLWCEVRQTSLLTGGAETKSYLKVTNLVPEKLQYFFIAAGVKQTFPIPFRIDRKEKIVRANGMFTYKTKRMNIDKLDRLAFEKLDRNRYTAHTVSKLFKVKHSGLHD
jgi:hypothetical protein